MRGIPYRKRPDPHPARTPAPRTPATRLQRTIARTASAKPCTQSSLPRHCARGMCAPNAHYKCRYAIRPPSCPNARLPPDPRHGATSPPRERPVQSPNPRMMTRDMPCQTAPEINWPQSRTTPGDCGLAWHDSGFGYQGSQVQILPIPPSITSCGSACARSSCASPPAGSPYPPEGAPTRATRPVCWSRSDPAAR